MASAAKSSNKKRDLITEVSKIVSEITGVQLGERQESMVESRIRRRIAALGFANESEYHEYLLANLETEKTALVSLLTTHHTFFFREFFHFEHLEKTALPALIAAKRKKGESTIKIWSAACSRGQEVYSLAMLMTHVLARLAPDFKFEILGSDVDPESVRIAKNGVYLHSEIKEVPLHFQAGLWAKGSGDISAFVKAKAKIRQACRFEVKNLLDPLMTYARAEFDIIFCRNVFIYFTQPQIREITSRLLKSMRQDGFLYLGISESLNGLKLPIQSIGPSIYAHPRPKLEVVANAAVIPTPSVSESRPMRVLCVDDSTMILNLLKKILVPSNGFEVVGTAADGLEAATQLAILKPDVMTLDIHMPNQNGLEYLLANMNANHPPVLMISSVSREDSGLALKCLEAGATDYVEKPALSNLADRSDEICVKLKYAHETRSYKSNLAIDRAFAHDSSLIKSAEKKVRVLIASLSNRKGVEQILADVTPADPATFVLMEGAGAGLSALAELMATKFQTLKTSVAVAPVTLQDYNKPGQLIFCDTEIFFKQFEASQFSAVSFSLLGPLSKKSTASLQRWPNAQIIVEDRGQKAPPKEIKASDFVPLTSFAYHARQYLAKGQ